VETAVNVADTQARADEEARKQLAIDEAQKAKEELKLRRDNFLLRADDHVRGKKFRWYTGQDRSLVQTITSAAGGWVLGKVRGFLTSMDTNMGMVNPLGLVTDMDATDLFDQFTSDAGDRAVRFGVRTELEAEFELNPIPDSDVEDGVDARAEGQSLKDLKYQPMLYNCTVTASNIFAVKKFVLVVSWELFSHLTNCQIWHYGMEPKVIEQRMLMASRSFHMINHNRYLLESVQQDTIRVAAGWAVGQSQSKTMLDFGAPLGASSLATAIAPTRSSSPH
jgi:hypothetical protein